MNEIFKEYKNIHKGESAVLVAGGPSLEKFIPLKDIIYVGVNHIGKYKLFNQNLPKSIKLDYYFFSDRDRYMEKDFEVTRQKFGSCLIDGEEHPAILTKKEVESLGGKAFEQSNYLYLDDDHGFPDDISESPCYGHTITMPALQFLIYAGISKIYLVGADCSGGPSFGIDGPDFFGKERDYTETLPDWTNFKKYLNKKKPNVRIVSINPVGLKGYFEDIYQYNQQR